MSREFALPVLSDERVALRRWRQDDAPAPRPVCGHPQICRFTNVPRRYTIEAARDRIARQQVQYEGVEVELVRHTLTSPNRSPTHH
jgi:hypothetical protein